MKKKITQTLLLIFSTLLLLVTVTGQSFHGTYRRTNNPDDTLGGKLIGMRVISFAGAWQGRLASGAMELVLQQKGTHVTGRLRVNSGDLGVIKDGIVIHDDLRFTIVRPGKVLSNGASLPDEYVGTGEVVMDGGGKSFNGTILRSVADRP